MATAREGVSENSARSSRQNRNPWSRGLISNCTDFWCSGIGELFGGGKPGEGMLGGQRVDYFKMYETPARMRNTSGGRSAGGARYESLANEEV